MEILLVFSRSREKKGPAALQRGDEGISQPGFALTYPIAAQWAPVPAAMRRSQALTLSRFAGEDFAGAF